MSKLIHKTAIVDAKAELASNVTVGPYSVIGPAVKIDSGTSIGSHVVIKGPTTIGKDNKIFQFASIGEDPQDLKYQGGETRLEIGDRNRIRECVTINRGTELGGAVTKIGDDNLLMAYTHIAHDCILHNHLVLATHVSVAGHVTIGDHAVLGGFSGVHQFCHIGAYSFAAAGSMIPKDILPYTKVSGYYAKPFGLNVVGLQRHQFAEKTIACLKNAYRIVYRQDLKVTEAVDELIKIRAICPEVDLMINMLKNSERGVVR